MYAENAILRPSEEFLTAARGMLQTAQKELLVKEGMKASVLDDLSPALLDFEKTLETSRVGRRLHTGASAELQAMERAKRSASSSSGLIVARGVDGHPGMRHRIAVTLSQSCH